MKKPLVRKILIVLAILFVVIQFYRIDKTNPPIDASQSFATIEQPPAPVLKLLKAACYDCHSNETKYPWYTNVMPFSFYVKGHIDHGRGTMNYSTWREYDSEERKGLLKESAEVIIETRMPLASYLIAHSEARITEEERKLLADWFTAQSLTSTPSSGTGAQ